MNPEDFLYRRALEDGRVVYVMPLLFGRAQIGLSPNDAAEWFDDQW